jgi:hypothetical protein
VAVVEGVAEAEAEAEAVAVAEAEVEAEAEAEAEGVEGLLVVGTREGKLRALDAGSGEARAPAPAPRAPASPGAPCSRLVAAAGCRFSLTQRARG